MAKRLAAPAIILVGVVAIVATVYALMGAGHPSDNVHYPYVCDTCGAVVDVSEYKADYPKNWRTPKGAPSDSVVTCLRCNKGWARPVAPPCPTCGTEYVLFMGDDRCPKCFPEAAEKVRKLHGKDSIFRRP